MNNKKTILIISAVIFFIAIIVWLIFFFSTKNSDDLSKTSTPTGSSQTITENSQNLPSSENNPPSFPNQKLPTSNTETKTNPNYNNLIINNSENQSQSREELKTFLSKTSTNDFTQVIDKNNQLIPLEAFANIANFKINPEVNSLLNTKDYQIIRCPENSNSFGIMFNIRLFPDRPHIYTETKALMKNWESTLFQDLHTIIFPNTNFSDSDIANQKPAFKDGKYRYAEITLPDKSKGSINYSIIFDSITVTNSLECLTKISNKVETLEP